MSSPAASISECPLHTVMGELAHVTVTQHVLYLEGECLPRSELVSALDQWTSLHSLIRNRICSASRSTPLSPFEFESAVGALLEVHRLPDSSGARPAPEKLQQAVHACWACSQSQTCPLGAGTRA